MERLLDVGVHAGSGQLTANSVRVEHTFPVIAAVVIPAFDLRAALRLRPGLETAPAALAPLPERSR